MKRTLGLAVMLCVIQFGSFAQNGVIRELSGDVQLKPAGASEFNTARAGDEVAQNTVVSTGFKSNAIIAIGHSVVTVRPLTRLTLSEIQSGSGAENINMNLQSGRVKVDVKPPAGAKTHLTVQSPSATASVRGTSFMFDTRNLAVFEGKVSFIGSSGPPTMVSAGGESFMGNNGAASDPADVSNENLQPPPPPGTGSSGENSGLASSTPTSGDFSIRIIYD